MTSFVCHPLSAAVQVPANRFEMCIDVGGGKLESRAELLRDASRSALSSFRSTESRPIHSDAWVSALIRFAMEFQDRLKRAREAQELAAQAQAEADKDAAEKDAKRREIAGEAAKKMLPQVNDAIQALMDDEPRSRAALMARRDPSHRWQPALGPMLGTVHTREKRRFLPGFAVYKGWGFIGWWVRSERFEFEVPLDGSPVAGPISIMSESPTLSLESFARKGIYDYYVGVDAPLERREERATQGFSDFLTEVMGHLLSLD